MRVFHQIEAKSPQPDPSPASDARPVCTGARVLLKEGMARVRVTEFLHVNVEVTDLDRALAFYRLFGLEELERPGTPARGGAWLRFPAGGELHLSVGTPRGNTRAHFAILVEDLEAARAAVLQAGGPIESERDIPGIARFFTRDPDGNRIEISQRR